MSGEDKLALLKLDLQMTATAYDQYLKQLISAAEGFVKREGIELSDTAEDAQLVIMYAAYLYRKRREDNPVMPRMLRWALNNRLFSQKAKVGEADG